MAIGAVPTTLEKLVRAYGALAEDGRLHELIWADGQARHAPARWGRKAMTAEPRTATGPEAMSGSFQALYSLAGRTALAV